jgi:uncharacterized protein
LSGSWDCRERLTRLCSRLPWCPKLAGIALLLQGGGEAHGFPHTVRVLCNALRLAEKLEERGETVDLEVLAAAALLHDVGRGFEEELGVHHAILSSIVARIILPGLGFDPGRVERVAKAILEHSFSIGGRPSSLESCLLSDADKLDALGAIGFYRLVETGASMGRTAVDSLAHYWEKLEKLPQLMCTEEARREALERLEKLRMIVETFREELLEYEDAVAFLEAEASNLWVQLPEKSG